MADDLNQEEMQRRVEALLDGTLDTRNLDRIFSWLRFRTHGHRLVRDVGDFAFHFTDRDQGKTVEGARLMSDALMTLPWTFWRLGHMAAPSASAGDVRRATVAGLEIKTDEWCRARFQMPKVRAQKTLNAALKKLVGLVNGTFQVSESLRPRELLVIRTLVQDVPDYLFSDKRLAKEFAVVLMRNGLISENKFDDVVALEGLLGVFTIEKMHNRRLAFGSGEAVPLYTSLYDGKLAIFGSFVTPWGDVEAQAELPVFVTDCAPNLWFENFKADALKGAIELTNGKLRAF
ncbi:hypothetical protein [Brevundimonas sp.]|uniref:hypothetical protein n=1 Tax=Brevundimonas sp. TaxID=1871086 RepID=UPI003F72F62C